MSFEGPFCEDRFVTLSEALVASWAGLCMSFMREAYELPRLGSFPGFAGVAAGVVACVLPESEEPI